MDSEVLVHVQAPSRFADDRRYAAIACNVLNFQPVSEICVTGLDEPDDLLRVPERSPNKSSSNYHATTNPEQSRAPSISSNLPCSNKLPGSGQNEDIRKVLGVSKLASSPNRNSKKSINPPYKSPLRSSTTRINAAGLEIGTPAKTALSSITKVVPETLVPSTERRGVKRAWSATLQDGPENVIVRNSQYLTPGGSSFPSQFFRSEAISLPTAASQEPFTSTPIAQVTNALPNLRSTESPKGSILNDVEPTENLGSSRLSLQDKIQTMGQEMRIHTHTDSNKDPAFTKDVARKIGSPLVSDVTTMSMPSAQRELDPHHPADGQATDRLVVQHSPINLNPSPDASAQYQGIFSAIEKLPVAITAPFSIGRHQWIPAPKLPILNATAEGLAMPKDFKPEKVTRAISQHERGYWKIPFAIEFTQLAQTSGRRDTTEVQFERSPGWQPLLTQKTLTQDEFVSVWKDLEEFIGSGNAGWSIRAIRRNFLIKRLQDSPTVQAQLHLQVYCYGEDIPYVYAMLLLCTRLHVLCKPLQWISTLDEKPIVTMTGDANRKGVLGPWTRMKNDLGKRFWMCP